MLRACARIGNPFGFQFVGAKVKRVADNERVRFDACKFADNHKARVGSKVLRHDERNQSSGALGEGKRGRSDIHFSVADHDVAVGPKSLHALVLVNVLVVSVQEIAVADNQIDHGILSAPVALIGIRRHIRRITPKQVEDLPPVVVSGRHLAIGVVVTLTARPGKALDLVPFGVLDQAKIRVRIAAGAFKVNAQLLEAFLKPILEVELLVLDAYGFDELARLDGEDALLKHFKACGFGVSLHSLSSPSLYPALETVA